MRTLVISRTIAALAAAVAAATAAAQAPAGSERGERAPPAATPRFEPGWGAGNQPIVRDRRASELIGTRVRNWRGEDLGRIEELVVDVAHDRVHYAVLSFDAGGLGGGKLFAYPVTLLRQGTGDELILNVSQEALERAPGFERSRWPDWGDRAYRESVDRHFGPQVAVQPRPGQQLRRASELIGAPVEDERGRPVGEIRDVVADLGSAELRYAVIDFPASWGPDDKLLALPMPSLGAPARDAEGLVLHAPRERLDLSRAFDEERWPDFGSKDYESGIEGLPGGAPPATGGR